MFLWDELALVLLIVVEDSRLLVMFLVAVGVVSITIISYTYTMTITTTTPRLPLIIMSPSIPTPPPLPHHLPTPLLPIIMLFPPGLGSLRDLLQVLQISHLALELVIVLLQLSKLRVE